MVLWRLRLSMLATVAAIIALSTLAFAALLQYLNIFSLPVLVGIVFIFNLLQWLFAPYMIEAIYRVREVGPHEMPRLTRIFEDLVRRSGISRPRLMIADVPLPNAFAYGSPLTGSRVALTTGLLERLEEEEVEAVIGHELGHLKHRDVQIMMFLSVLPAIFYFIAQSLFLSSLWNGRGRNAGVLALLGILAFIIYFVLNLLVLGVSRLREYYADQHAVRTVNDGARKLAEGLAKIVRASGLLKLRGDTTSHSFKALFISDPDATTEAYGYTDRELVQAVASRPITLGDRLLELFSTHPNVTKRVRALLRQAR
jgi:heat shock protein HtpX